MGKKQIGVRTQDAIKGVPVPVPVPIQYKNIITKYVPKLLSKFSKYELIKQFLLLFGCKSQIILALILLAI